MARNARREIALFSPRVVRQAPAPLLLGLLAQVLLLLGLNVPAPARTYTTSFSATENPISEGGNWINGKTHGLDWADVRTVNGMAVGTQSGTRGTDDSTAVLTGTWGPNQTVSATVHNANPNSAYFQEVELRLRSTISAHRNAGYEVLFGLRNDSSAYVSIVRWNGAFNDWTTLDAYGGSQYILREGDVVMGVISNQTISAYINGVKVMQVTDGTFSSGNPGLGFYLANATEVNTDYGLTSFTASDDGGSPVNNPPVAYSQSVSTPKDTAMAITLTGSDPENNSLSYSVSPGPSHGTLGGTAPNLTYWPAAGYTGPDSFNFYVYDGNSWSSAATVSVNVTAPAQVNNPPTANPQSVSTPRDAPVAITLTGSDPEGSFLYYSAPGSPQHGTLSGTAPNLTYQPAAGYTGPDSFTFHVSDGNSWSSPGTVSITVTAVANNPPTANSRSVNTSQNTSVGITLTGSDPENSPLRFAVTENPAHGSLSGAPPNLTYQPTAGYAGSDSFTFKVNDGQLDSAPATISITVVAGNSPPTANSQSVATTMDTPVAITLTGSDPENSFLYYSAPTTTGHGTLSGTAPNFTYQPIAGYTGPDSFEFHVYDGIYWSAAGTVSISVTDSSSPPPPPPPVQSSLLRSTSISLSVQDTQGGRAILNGDVTVRDQNGMLVASASVMARWTLPNGNLVNQTATTSAAGIASFSTKGGPGLATLTVINITKANYTFDSANSVLSQSVNAGN